MSNVLLAPGIVEVRFALDPVHNNLASLYLLGFAETHAGVDDWVKRTAASLPAEWMRTNTLLMEVLYSALEPDEDWPSFPAYLEHLAQCDPVQMRKRFLSRMLPHADQTVAAGREWMDLQVFVAQIERSEFDREFESDVLAEAHALLADPLDLRRRISSHLTEMWYEVLAPEWEQNRDFLARVIAAFEDLGLSDPGAARQSAYEAIRLVTGREVHGSWQDVLASAETLVFVPSPHIGPYLLPYAYPPVVRILFGARPPRRTERPSTTLSRADLLVQLRALGDDTRLRILELLREEGRLSSQEIAAQLQLSKSSASRHLSQLSATGYLIEHQGAAKTKLYTLNTERFAELLRFLEGYARA